ncbi:MAG: hypothetical protein K6T85_12555 [Gorillibacterium sp.]|nr:hypothetical protein [Gorillibacterium sp.]
MRPLIVAELVTLESITLLSAEIYDECGRLLQPVIVPVSGADACAAIMRDFAELHRIDTFDVWTSDRNLYVACLSEPGISAYIKHSSDTDSVRHTIERERDVFVDLYVPKPEQPVVIVESLPPLSAWRVWISKCLRVLLKRIEGDDKFEIYKD